MENQSPRRSESRVREVSYLDGIAIKPVYGPAELAGFDHARDLAAWRDAVYFLVIGFGNVQHAVSCDHAVPVAVGLKVVHVGVRNGMSVDKLAQVGNERPGALIAVHPVKSVRYVCIAV